MIIISIDKNFNNMYKFSHFKSIHSKSIFLICFLSLVFGAQAKVIDVSAHGISPGKDITFELQQLIKSVSNEENITLVFPKGQYDFYPDNAIEKYRYVANHDNGLKRMGFGLFNSRKLTIDGSGSTFMFHGRMVPFTVESGQNITLKNFTIDFIRPFHAELTVVKSNKVNKTFQVKVDKQNAPYKIQDNRLFFDRFGQLDPTGSNIVFNPKTRSPIFNTYDYGLPWLTLHAKLVGDDIVELSNIGNRLPPPKDSVLIVYGNNPTSRLVPGIHITNSKDVKIDNVSVLAAGGMALIVERTENIHVNKFTVSSADERLVATRADATHFIGCKGEIIVENSLMEHMLDDGINVHGAYVNIDAYLGDNKFIASISHFQQMGLIFGEVGDRIAILSRETVLPFFESSITAIEVLNDKRFVVTLADTPDNLPNVPMSLENLTWHPNLTFRNNIVMENRARGALVTTKGKVLIENNYFNNQMHGILIEGDNKSWYESGAVEDVIIRSNTFVNTGFSGKPHYPLFVSPMLTSEQRIGEGYYHKNVQFIDNNIRSFNGLLVHSKSVDGLIVSGNTLTFSDDYPTIKDYPSVDINYSNNVQLIGNTAKRFNWPLATKMSNDSKAIQIKGNDGFKQ